MSNPGWSNPQSPFHAGERAIQARLGIEDRLDRQGRRIIRDYLVAQHQEFFGQLSYVLVGTVDAAGHPWASVLLGVPGFLASPDPHTLQVRAQPLAGDPLGNILAPGIDIGLLGIELPTRRRNRLNGVVNTVQPGHLVVTVRQSFGNCPQYIQARQPAWEAKAPASEQSPVVITPVTCWGEAERKIIAANDTFFVATAYQDPAAGAASGVDISHRGGKPGFVRIDGDRHLTFPDFSGNQHFNTLGNLTLNPRAGLLLVDFDHGHLLYLTGTTDIDWDPAAHHHYAGAERLIHFRLETGYRVEGSFPHPWSSPEQSPFLHHTGPTWQSPGKR